MMRLCLPPPALRLPPPALRLRACARARRVTLVLALAWAACAGGLVPVHAHESEAPKALVVMREAGHCTLTLHFDLARALRLTMQPQAAPAEFLAQASAQAPATFAREWNRVTARWAREVLLEQPAGRFDAQRWRWPTADEAQALLRQQLMQGLTGDSPEHAPALAQAQGEFRIAPGPSARLFLPTAFRPLTLTSYRPHQQSVAPGESPISLKF